MTGQRRPSEQRMAVHHYIERGIRFIPMNALTMQRTADGAHRSVPALSRTDARPPLVEPSVPLTQRGGQIGCALHKPAIGGPGADEPVELPVPVVEDDMWQPEQQAEQMAVQAIGDHRPPGAEKPQPARDPARCERRVEVLAMVVAVMKAPGATETHTQRAQPPHALAQMVRLVEPVGCECAGGGGHLSHATGLLPVGA